MQRSDDKPNNNSNRPDQKAVDILLDSIKETYQLNDLYQEGKINSDDVTAFFNSSTYHRFIWGGKFIPALEMFSQHQEVLINLLLTNTSLYNSVMMTENLITIAKMFPQHAAALITLPDKHYRFICAKIRKNEDLIQALKELPDYQSELLNITLNPPENPLNVIGYAYKLKEVVAVCLPAHKGTLLGCLLKNEEAYNTLMMLQMSFTRSELFPDHRDIVSQMTYDQALEAYNNRKNNTAAPTIETTPQPAQPDPESLLALSEPKKTLLQPSFSLSFALNTSENTTPEINLTPEKPQTKLSTSSPLKFFDVNAELVKRKQERRDRRFDAINEAINEYLNWYDTGKSYRGPSGYLAGINHRDNGKQTALKIRNDIQGADYEKLDGVIFTVLTTSPFKNHSLGSFLLDRLLNIEASLWDEKKYPGYKRKYRAGDLVMHKTSNQTNTNRNICGS